MNTKTKAILAGTLLTALFAGQTAIASQATEEGFFSTEITKSETTVMNINIIKVSDPALSEKPVYKDTNDDFFPQGASN